MVKQADSDGAATAGTNEKAFTFEEIVLAEPGPEQVALDEQEEARVQRRKARAISPGPWSYEDTHDASCGRACTPEGCFENHRSGLYRIEGPDWYDYDVVYPDVVCNEADARLIAAAPDLLAALKELLDQAVDDVDDRRLSPAVEQARAAIAKAEGRTLPPVTDRVEYDADGLPVRFYPETR